MCMVFGILIGALECDNGVVECEQGNVNCDYGSE